MTENNKDWGSAAFRQGRSVIWFGSQREETSSVYLYNIVKTFNKSIYFIKIDIAAVVDVTVVSLKMALFLIPVPP